MKRRSLEIARLTASILMLGPILGSASPAGDGPSLAQEPGVGPAQRPVHLTLAPAPAVAAAGTQPGQSWARTFQMSNFTAATCRFIIEVRDIVAKDGIRTFVPAGETQGGIAATAVVSPREIEIAPNSVGAVTVTVTVPQRTSPRGVVISFREAMDTPAEPGAVGMGASLDAPVTFELPMQQGFGALDLSSTPQTDASNLTISLELQNAGREPAVPRGAGAIRDDAGRRVRKVIFAGV